MTVFRGKGVIYYLLQIVFLRWLFVISWVIILQSWCYMSCICTKATKSAESFFRNGKNKIGTDVVYSPSSVCAVLCIANLCTHRQQEIWDDWTYCNLYFKMGCMGGTWGASLKNVHLNVEFFPPSCGVLFAKRGGDGGVAV